MVRLLLLSSPALCLLSGVGVSELLNYVIKQYKNFNEEYDPMGNLIMTEPIPLEEQGTNKKRETVYFNIKLYTNFIRKDQKNNSDLDLKSFLFSYL